MASWYAQIYLNKFCCSEMRTVRACSVPDCNDSLSLSPWHGSRISLWTVYPSKPEIIKILTSVITEQPTSCSTCKVIHLRTSFVCCCWTYHLEQFTWISAWSWTFNRQLKTFLFVQYWRRHSSALETFVPSCSINLLFTFIYITVYNSSRLIE